jgi:hypothetical protein
MRYFTRDRYLALQNFQEEAMDAADADWEAAVAAYEAYLQTIRPEMSETVRQLLDGFYLHDARVLSMGQRGDSFVISLQLDVPPNDLLTITYTLAGPPEVNKETFPWVTDAYTVDWLYEEVELIHQGDRKHFVHSILFSNGWEIRLPFRDVQTTTAFPLLPHPRYVKTGEPPMPATQSA